MPEDVVLAWMKTSKIEITRENYIDIAFCGEPPDPWTAADEALLPDELQDWSKYKISERDVERIG